jgi:hypothetical protein
MQDLTRDGSTGAKAVLVPSSMSGGNTVYDDPQLAMTAPGSPGVNNYAEVNADVLPQPQLPGDQIPVSHPGNRDRVTVKSGAQGGGGYEDAHAVPSSALWKEMS